MEFFVSKPLEIKKQDKPGECVACAISSIIEDNAHTIIDPRPIYIGADDGHFGQVPASVCKAAVILGYVQDYHSVWPIWNYFVAIKRTLLNKKKSVLTGCYWQPEWDKAEGGVIKSWHQNLEIFPHAFKVFGIKEMGGVEYLVVQNSNGTAVGDNGIFYFPEEIVRKFQFAYFLDY